MHLSASLCGQEDGHLEELCETDTFKAWHLTFEGSLFMKTNWDEMQMQVQDKSDRLKCACSHVEVSPGEALSLFLWS